jgi:3-deoxy-D-manno-octulosonic-acid transferase
VSYLLYNLIVTIVFIVVLPLVPFVLLLPSRYRDGLGQRLGFYPRSVIACVGSKKLVWIHASSVGEVRAAASLVHALKARAPERTILVSTFTATGNRIAQSSGADAVIFLPLDFFPIVRRALKKIDPALLIFIETEIWPNLLRQSHRRGIPTVLLSGRLSAKALPRYLFWQSFFQRVLACYTVIGMQSAEDAARMLKLGADQKKISVVGSLKFAANGNGAKQQFFSSLRAPKRPLFVAGSSHRGEEEILLKVLELARTQCPKLSMVLAPRHPERCGEVEKLLSRSSFAYYRKSQITSAQYFDRDVLLLDTVGELTDFFAAGDVAFVGGSLVDAGGHNVLEPARLHKPVLFGPYMSNFKNIAEKMKQTGAAIEVHSADDLARALCALLADGEARLRMGQRAAQCADAGQSALARNLDLAARYL